MIKFTGAGRDGRQILFLGLSYANLDGLRRRDDYIPIDPAELGLDGPQVIIFAGETEEKMTADLAARGLLPPGVQEQLRGAQPDQPKLWVRE